MKGSHSKTYTTVSGRERTRRRHKWLPGAVLAFFMLAGILLALRDLMAGDICLISAGMAGMLVILAGMAIDRDSRAGRIARLAVYGVGVAGFLVLILFVSGGFLDAVNRLITLWNLRFDTDGRLFKVSGGLVSSAAFWTLLAIPLSAFLGSRVRKRRMGLLTVLLSAALLFAFAVGRSAGWGAVLFLGLGILGAFLYVAAPGRILQMRGAMCILLTGIAVFLLAAASGKYDGSESLNRWKREARNRAEQVRYGEDSLPKGELYRAQALLDNEEETLRLSVEKPQELYLRGFVGSAYRRDRWAPFVWADYQGEYEGILEWLKGQDFIPMAQYAEYDRMDRQHGDRRADSVQVKVENVGAYRKYVYLPVSVSSWEGAGAKEEKDSNFLSGRLFGAREYTFDMVDQVPTAEKFLTPQWLEEPETPEQEEYCNTESVYHSFVEDTYLDVDEETRSLIQEEFFSGEEQTEDFSGVTRQIRRVLRAKAAYTQVPQKLPEGEDMVSWFLKEAGAGNAVHFATAAVMAYRTAGYPARYVEGYHLTADQAEDMAEEGQQDVTLTGQNAHAWAEVYLFGAGWLPVEVTPGMYTESYTEQIVEGKPAYQIGTHRENEGLNLEEGENRARDEEKEETDERERIPLSGPAEVLLLLYLLLLLFLFLEAQRAVRIFLRRRKHGHGGGEEKVGQDAGQLERLLRIGGVRGDYDHPLDMGEQVEARFPGILEEDYRRAVELLQKEEFGGHTLRKGETYTLRRFGERLRESLYRKKGLFYRLRLRYWYAVERGEAEEI